MATANATRMKHVTNSLRSFSTPISAGLRRQRAFDIHACGHADEGERVAHRAVAAGAIENGPLLRARRRFEPNALIRQSATAARKSPKISTPETSERIASDAVDMRPVVEFAPADRPHVERGRV